MNNKDKKYISDLIPQGLPSSLEEMIKREMEGSKVHQIDDPLPKDLPGIYDKNDFEVLLNMKPQPSYALLLQTLDKLIEQDKQRERDGFPRKIRLGKLVKPSKDNKGQVVIVPTTTETKFYHDDNPSQEDESTGGVGDGNEGDVIGEQPINPQTGEGEGQGAGQGGNTKHDVISEAFDLGRILTEKFELPNLKDKGKKKSLIKHQYDLTDRNDGFGQILDKKSTLKKVIETNIHLGNIKDQSEILSENLVISPEDKVYRILSKEQDYESQAVVFFLRDYSGSMQGRPTEVITSQHLFIYSWLMYQYKNNVESRFIVHDTEAKEVEDFYTYYKSTVAGGTNVYPAYDLVVKIIEEENLAKDYNIYVFHGTDGDDWDTTGERMLKAAKKILKYVNRLGITIAKNSWGSYSDYTTVERYLEDSGILNEMPDLVKMDTMIAEKVTEDRIIEGIKRLVG
ncbi:MAG: DUF444 family protein [Microscillaceae bacterium]|nr:DUF444 family protein [Microscillaceae bacterium]